MSGHFVQQQVWQVAPMQPANGRHANAWPAVQYGGQSQVNEWPEQSDGAFAAHLGGTDRVADDIGEGPDPMAAQPGRLLGKRARETTTEGLAPSGFKLMGGPAAWRDAGEARSGHEGHGLRTAKRHKSDLRVPTTSPRHAEVIPPPHLTGHDRSQSFTNVVIQRTGSMTLDPDANGLSNGGGTRVGEAGVPERLPSDQSQGGQQGLFPPAESSGEQIDFVMSHGPNFDPEPSAGAIAFSPLHPTVPSQSKPCFYQSHAGYGYPVSPNGKAATAPFTSRTENSELLAQMPVLLSIESSGVLPISKPSAPESSMSFTSDQSSMDQFPRHSSRVDSAYDNAIAISPRPPPSSLRSVSTEVETYWMDGMQGLPKRVVSSGSISPESGRSRMGAQIMDGVMIEDDVDMALSSPDLPAVPPGSRSNSFGAGNLIGPNDITMSSFAKSGRSKYTQGPRADCGKCAAGVAGHYGHWV